MSSFWSTVALVVFSAVCKAIAMMPLLQIADDPKAIRLLGNTGLLAYIVEKLQTWGDCKGDVESRFTMDEVSHRSL